MLEETKNLLIEMIVELHDQARLTVDSGRAREIRKVADEISNILEKEKNASR